MDYLRSNSSNKKLSVTRVSSKIKVKPKDIYDDLLMNIFDKLTSDEKAELLDKFLDDNIIAVLSDNELFSCIESFFRNDLSVAETSRNSYLHRNTLLYRIEKIEKLTGLNIRNFEDAVTFELLARIYTMMKKYKGM